jgi:hypothetical protein
MNTLEVDSIEASYRRLLLKLENEGKLKVKQVIPINNNRYIIVKAEPENIMIMFKREVFFNFGRMFREQGAKGVGDSINAEDLKQGLRSNVKTIYTLFPNGHIYHILLTDILEKGIKWQNKESKEVYSFSIHEYKLFDILKK